MVRGLDGAGIPAQAMIFKTPQRGHAIAVYDFGGSLWGWDSYWKSNRLRSASFSDAPATARNWLRVTMSKETVERAEFLY